MTTPRDPREVAEAVERLNSFASTVVEYVDPADLWHDVGVLLTSHADLSALLKRAEEALGPFEQAARMFRFDPPQIAWEWVAQESESGCLEYAFAYAEGGFQYDRLYPSDFQKAASVHQEIQEKTNG
jgi:hypothetical protein